MIQDFLVNKRIRISITIQQKASRYIKQLGV